VAREVCGAVLLYEKRKIKKSVFSFDKVKTVIFVILNTKHFENAA